MNTLLLRNFRKFEGLRGAHFYCSEGCRFLPWAEVVQFASSLPSEVPTEFSDKLLNMLANYDPDTQYLAVGDLDGKTVLELYPKNNVE